MKATEHLKTEHQEIELMLRIMKKISKDVGGGRELNVEHYEKIMDFIKVFYDKNHHAKEELVLFPAMEAKGVSRNGGMIEIEIHEHQLGRSYIKALNHSFEEYKKGDEKGTLGVFANLLNYTNLLQSHIKKEDEMLYALADKVLNEKEQEKLAVSLEKLEVEVMGKGKHKEYQVLLKELSSFYL